MSVRVFFVDFHLPGMRDKSIQSETKLGREIQVNDWSKAREQGKLVFVVSTKPTITCTISFPIHNEKKIVFRTVKLPINSRFSL